MVTVKQSRDKKSAKGQKLSVTKCPIDTANLFLKGSCYPEWLLFQIILSVVIDPELQVTRSYPERN